MGKRRLTAGVLLVVVALVGACADAGKQPQSLSDAVLSLGFAQVNPPTTLAPPGTLIWIQQGTPFSSGVLCTRSNALGDELAVEQVPTLSAQWRQQASAGLSVGGDLAQRLNAQLGADYVHEVKLSLTNAQVLAVNDAQVLDQAERHDPSSGCLAAIHMRQQEGDALSIVRSVLQADIEYSVSFSASANAAVKAQVAEEIAASVEGSVKVENNSTVLAKGTFIGVKDDAVLFRGFMQSNGEARLGDSMDSSFRALPADAVVRFVSNRIVSKPNNH